MSLLGSCTTAIRTATRRSAGRPTQCPACEHPGASAWERLAYTGRLSRRGADRCMAGSDDDTGWGPQCACEHEFHARSARAQRASQSDGPTGAETEPLDRSTDSPSPAVVQIVDPAEQDRTGQHLADSGSAPSTPSASR